MKTKIVILDFDGTLSNSYHIITETMMATFQELNLPYRSPEVCAKTIGLPLKDSFLLLQNIQEREAQVCVDTYETIFHRNNIPGAVPPYPMVIDTIRTLHALDIRMTIASSRGHESLERYVQEYQIADCISYILGNNDVEHAKPHAEPVLKTLQHFQLQPSDALVVGDTTFDIEMGKNADCKTCGVTYGNGKQTDLEAAGATYIIDNFKEIIKLCM